MKLLDGILWDTHSRFGRPKMRFCVFLTVFWLAVSLPSFFLILNETFRDVVGTAYLLSMACIVILEIVWIALLIFFYCTERPRTCTERHVREQGDMDVD